jgi:hypothetical protein
MFLNPRLNVPFSNEGTQNPDRSYANPTHVKHSQVIIIKTNMRMVDCREIDDLYLEILSKKINQWFDSSIFFRIAGVY